MAFLGDEIAVPASRVVTIVPMKSLATAKSRLSVKLSARQREALGLNLLRRVLLAIADSPVKEVWVVGGDTDVAKVAQEEGATWLEEEGSDLNETLWWAFKRSFQQGKAALYLPGDLPFLKPEDIAGMVETSGRLRNVVLSPSRFQGGTNGILVPGDLPFKPMLGPDSFHRHLAQAEILKLPAAIYYSVGLGLDLDTLEDLRSYEFLEPGLGERLTAPETNIG